MGKAQNIKAKLERAVQAATLMDAPPTMAWARAMLEAEGGIIFVPGGQPPLPYTVKAGFPDGTVLSIGCAPWSAYERDRIYGTQGGTTADPPGPARPAPQTPARLDLLTPGTPAATIPATPSASRGFLLW